MVEKTNKIHGEEAIRVAIEEILKRFDTFLVREFKSGRPERGLLVFAEGRFDRRAKILVRDFRALGTKYGVIHNLADNPFFASMKESRVLQAADYIAQREELRAKIQFLEELLPDDQNIRDATEFQRHRDRWRRYAYGECDKPSDFLGSPVNDDPTEIDRLRTEFSRFRDEVESLHKKDAALNAAKEAIKLCREHSVEVLGADPDLEPISVEKLDGDVVPPKPTASGEEPK